VHEVNLLVRLNASDRAVYETFISQELGITAGEAAVKSFNPTAEE
jgi:hypothetical protein